MSSFAPLQLQGLGTEHVESIVSYVARIAHVHGVSPLKVHQLVCSRQLHGELSLGVQYGGFRMPSLAGYSGATKTYIRRLESLTHQTNLECGTLLKLAPMLAPNGIGAIYRRLRWCPECFSQAEEHSPELLIWQFVTCHYCPRDGSALLISCPHCGAARAPLRALEKRRYCFRCRHDLADGTPKRTSIGRFQMWQQKQSEELVRLIAQPDWSGVATDGLREIVDGLRGESLQVRRNRKIEMPLLTRVLKRIRKRHAAPQLVSVFLCAAELGVPVRSVFETPLVVMQARLLEGVPQGRPAFAARRVSVEAKERLVQTLRELAAKDEGVPPTLNQLCGAAGMRASMLYQFDRNAYGEYAKHRMKKVKDVRATRISRAFWTAFFLEVVRRREAGIELEVREIGRAISSITGANKSEAEKMLNAAKIMVQVLGTYLNPNLVDSVMFRKG